MPNFPANYAEQEKYYASEEYQSSAKAAIANNEPLPTYEKNKDLGKRLKNLVEHQNHLHLSDILIQR